MLKTKLVTIKYSCCMLFIPKIFKGSLQSSQRIISKRTYEMLCVLSKSTDTGINYDYKKKLSIIQKCFTPNDPFTESSFEEVNMKGNDMIIEKPFNTTKTKCEKCQNIIAKAFEKSVKNKNLDDINNSITLDDVKVQSTARKQDEEILAQKLEKIDEISVVEADAKIDDFNAPPKTLSNVDPLKCLAKSNDKESKYDDVAKRCLKVPVNEIDMRLLSEFEKLTEKPSVSSTTINEVSLDFTPIREENYFGDVFYKSNYTTLFDNSNKYMKESLSERTHSDTQISEYNNLVGRYIYPFRNQESEEVTNSKCNSTIRNTYRSKDMLKHRVSEKRKLEATFDACAVKMPGAKIKRRNKLEKLLKTKNEDSSKDTVIDDTEKIKGVAFNAGFIKKYRPESSQSIVFTETQGPPSTDETEIQTEQQDEVIMPNTAISGTFPIPSPPSTVKPQLDTAISARQDFNDFSKITPEKTVVNYSTKHKNALEPAKPVMDDIYSIESNSAQDSDRLDLTPQSIHPISQVLFGSQLNTEADTSANISAETTKTPAEILKSSAEAALYKFPAIRQDMPLSEILKLVRRRNRLEFYRDFAQATEDVVMKKSPCIPPLDTSGKPKDSLGPQPCRPAPKKTDTKGSPCPPKKKNPCVKFSTLGVSFFQNVFSIWSDFHLCTTNVPNYVDYRHLSTKPVLKGDVESLHEMNNSCSNELDFDRSVYARDFEPWCPIPCWPYPKKEEKRPFVCRKDGCKMIPPPNFWGPCDKNNPCRGFPSYPKRRFSSHSYPTNFN